MASPAEQPHVDSTTSAAADVRYEGPVPAPIEEGQQIGHVEVAVPDLPVVKVPLIAKHSVETGGFLTRMQAAGQLLLEPLFPG